MVDRELFVELGGFEESYRSGFEDFDFCQRAMREGRIPIYTPAPTVISHQPPAARRARFDVVDRALFVDLFYDELRDGDRFYNRGFKRERANFEPAARPNEAAVHQLRAVRFQQRDPGLPFRQPPQPARLGGDPGLRG